MNGDRIMVRRKLFICNIDVELLIMKGHNIQSLSKRMILVTFDEIKDLFIDGELMSSFERNHNQRNFVFGLKNPFKGSGVTVNVELSSWSDVTSFNGSSHHNYPFYF